MKLLRHRLRRGFTLLEIMIVVAIIGIVMAMAIPSFVRMNHAEGMRRAIMDFMEASRQARANAILSGQPAELVIHPKTRQIEATGRTPFSATLPPNVWIEIVGVNFVDLTAADEARVKFQPNATCDEFDMILMSSDNEKKEFKLEVVTGLLDMIDL